MNRTKELLSGAFWQLLEEKPFNKITVQNIVERCQVNRNTFYYHFQDIPALAEFSIYTWADQLIKENCELGAPINCIRPITEEFTKRKNAFIHIYRSTNQDSFLRYLNDICFHAVYAYITKALGTISVSPEVQNTLIRYYKCAASGIILDWLNASASYDLTDFCEKTCTFLNGSGKRAFLKHIVK